MGTSCAPAQADLLRSCSSRRWACRVVSPTPGRTWMASATRGRPPPAEEHRLTTRPNVALAIGSAPSGRQPVARRARLGGVSHVPVSPSPQPGGGRRGRLGLVMTALVGLAAVAGLGAYLIFKPAAASSFFTMP